MKNTNLILLNINIIQYTIHNTKGEMNNGSNGMH